MPSMRELHLLLTYRCTMACAHCFVWGSPDQSGAMTLAQLSSIFEQGDALGTIEGVCFEGGEPFLPYDLLLEGVRRAKVRGWRAEAISNAYWATSRDAASARLRPLAAAGLDGLLVSRDAHHGGESPPAVAAASAEELGIETSTITIREAAGSVDGPSVAPGEPITGGAVHFRGRAAEQLTAGLPRRPWRELATCPHEELADPKRVHIDPLGYVHLCQGLALGNLFRAPLAALVDGYDARCHPVCGPLLAGGPAALAEAYSTPHADSYVDECHMCYDLRGRLRERFPEELAPAQMYGVVGAATGGAG